MAIGPRGLLAFWMGGAAAAPAAEQGGTRSMLAPWLGGASAPAASSQGGVTSLLAPWMGGAAAAPVAEQGGFGGLLAFWMGGAYAGAAIPPVIHPPSGGTPFVMRLPAHDARDEEDMWLLLIGQMIASGQIH